MGDKERGLYPKYVVLKRIDDQTVETVDDWVFVLNPKTDPGARFALKAYAVWCRIYGHHKLSDEISEKLGNSPVPMKYCKHDKDSDV